jgi:hypothetical protein
VFKSIKKFAGKGGRGSRFHFPNVSNLTYQKRVSNSLPNFVRPQEGEFVLEITEHAIVPFLIEDSVQSLAYLPMSEFYTQKTGEALGRAMDDDIMRLRASCSQILSTADGPIDEAAIIYCGILLDQQDVPVDGWMLAVSPAQGASLRTLPAFEKVTDMANRRIIGRLHGFDVMTTNRIKPGDSGAPGEGGGIVNVHYAVAFHRDAFIYSAPVENRLQSQYLLTMVGTVFLGDEIYGQGIFRDDYAVIIPTLELPV